MDDLLESLEYNYQEKSAALPKKLIHLLHCPFLVGNDLVLLKSDAQFIPEKELATAVDKCAYEDIENHFHIDDYVDDVINYNSLAFFELGLAFTMQLADRLQSEFPKISFRVLLSFGAVDSDKQHQFGNCVTRFYTIRAEAETAFRIQNLEVFKNEAILTIETNNQAGTTTE